MRSERFDRWTVAMVTRRRVASGALLALPAAALLGRAAPAAADHLRDCSRKKKYVCPPTDDCVRRGHGKRRRWTCMTRTPTPPGVGCSAGETTCPDGGCVPLCDADPVYFCKRFGYCYTSVKKGDDEYCSGWIGCEGPLECAGDISGKICQFW